MKCEDQFEVNGIVFTTRAELKPSGNKDCHVNDGRKHYHLLQVENRRREQLRISGEAQTVSRQLVFEYRGKKGTKWDFRFPAYGSKKPQPTKEQADILIENVNSTTEDIEVINLSYTFKDHFDDKTVELNRKLSFRVSLSL